MLSIKNLTYYIGSRALYENASLHIKEGEKVGLIGLNGTGKSTLLKIIAGEKKSESGNITIEKDGKVGFFNQDLLSYITDESIRDVAIKAFDNLLEIQSNIDGVISDMEKEYSDDLLNKLTSLQDVFASKGGYEIEARTDAVLEGIGFSTKDLTRPLSEFSGGWRMRVMLAKLLLEKPSVLMLDEPTNHLDIKSIQWLENYLKTYSGSVIIVSHDRSFLDGMTNKTVEVCNKVLTSYAGNYSFYEKEKELRAELQDKAYKNQQQQIKQTQEFIQRFGSKASKASQVQSRVKTLEKMERVEKSSDDSSKIKFTFPVTQKSGKIIAEITDINKSFGENKILENASIQINRGDKIALIGPNGKGKSTLLYIISEAIEKGTSDNCKINIGHNVIPSFFSQHQLDSLDKKNTVLQELASSAPQKTEPEIRKIAGMFLFTKDDINKKIDVLSGGEKSRVALAKVLLNDANFLILDEPTNHLDMASVATLAQALQKYEGTFLVVSHDRHFLSLVANKIWSIENLKVEEFLGTYVDYALYNNARK